MWGPGWNSVQAQAVWGGVGAGPRGPAWALRPCCHFTDEVTEATEAE